MGTIENKKAKNALENLLNRQNYLVTQANELARAFGNLKATEHKILDYCFSYIKKEDTVDTVYHLTLQEILKHLGLNASGRNYTRVAIALQKLHEKTALYLQLYDEDGTPFIRMTSLFQHIDIKSNGTVEIKYNADIAPYIFQLKQQYYSFKLLELGRVRSKYTLIMLKLWNANAGKWNDYTDPNSLPPNLYLTASLEEWESWFLGYTIDKEKKKHPVRWPAGRFKQKVLDVALKELAELYPKSTISITPTKRGRRVVGYTLEIRQINTALGTNTVVIDGKPQSPRTKGKQGVTNKPHKKRETFKSKEKKNTKKIKDNRNKDQAEIDPSLDELKNIMSLWVKTFGIDDFKYASEYLELFAYLYPYDLIMDQITAHKDYAKNAAVTVEMIIDLMGSSLKKAYKEDPNELSEFEKIKQELARLRQEKAELEAKLNNKPKEVKGLFDDTDLKQAEKQITNNLDKMTGKSPQNWEQTDLFK